MQSVSENDFECFASTGVKSPAKAIFRAHERAKEYEMGPLNRMTDPVADSQPPSSAACQSLRSAELPRCNLLTHKETQRPPLRLSAQDSGVWRLCNG